jgi:hypothetical protein
MSEAQPNQRETSPLSHQPLDEPILQCQYGFMSTSMTVFGLVKEGVKVEMM